MSNPAPPPGPDDAGHVFVCKDCGVEVTRFVLMAANDQELCLECEFLRTIEDPGEREELRRVLRQK